MSVDNFVPEIWSTRLLRHLDRTLIYAQPTVCNRDWEGEIRDAGDTVHIQKVGDPTIFTYVPGVDMQSPERPDGETLALVVDQFRAFNVAIDDVDAAQVNVDLLDRFAERAGVKMAQDIDAHVAAKMVAAAVINTVGDDDDPVVIKADGNSGDYTPYEFAVECRRQLAAQDAPLDNLWMAISPDLEAEFLKDEAYIDTATRTETRTGQIGQVAGFDILRTTGVPVSGAGSGSGGGSGSGSGSGSGGGSGSGSGAPVSEKILAGAGNYATTFAGQLTKIEAYRIQDQFGDAVKGLEVYGAKVVEPQTLVCGHVAKS